MQFLPEGSTMATSQVQGSDAGMSPPKKGDKFRCAECGMQIEVTTDCKCKEGEKVHFHCCGKEMSKS
jgi:hypothetical protein